MAKVSIVIPCLLLPDKDRELTRFTIDCVNSISAHILTEYELIIIDNGSEVDSGTLVYLSNICIRNRHNLGFARAVNQGMKLATGEYIVVCNNDIVFMNDWINEAVSAFKWNTGVVSSHLQDAPRMVVNWGEMFGALWMTSRGVVNKVGYLDEGYGIGMYEDKDYWMRMKDAGLELVKAGFCKHIGNGTWGKMPNQEEIFFKNKKRFEDRWLSK